MGKKSKKPLKTETETAPTIISGDGKAEPRVKKYLKRHQKALTIICVIIIVLGGSWFAYALYQNSQKLAPLPADISRDYATTEVQYVPLLLEHEHGINPNKLKAKDLPKKLTDYKTAHDVAVALYRLDKTDLSVQAYDIAYGYAEKKQDVGIIFYQEMYGIAYGAGNNTIGDKAYNKAVAITKSAPGLTDDDRDYRLRAMSWGQESTRK